MYLAVTAPGCYKHSGDGVEPQFMQLDVPTCTTPTTSKGYVRVFRRLNRDDITENWVQIGADADIEGEHAGDYFGLSLSMAYDYESPVMVGAPFWKEQGGTDVRVGRAYVYAYDPFMSKRYKHFKTLQGDSHEGQVWLVAGDGPRMAAPAPCSGRRRPTPTASWMGSEASCRFTTY